MSSREIHIYFVRHGETTANVDHTLYTAEADHAFPLTPKGVKQAEAAGAFLASHFKERLSKEGDEFGNIKVWYSPYYRTRMTANYILEALGEEFYQSGKLSYEEENRIYEQRVGLFDSIDDENFKKNYPEEHLDFSNKKHRHGGAYAQTPMGESRMDTVHRVEPFFNKIWEEAEEDNVLNVVVVSHGVTIRAMEMALMGHVPEWLNSEINPENCWIRSNCGNKKTGFTDEGYIHGDGAPLRDPMKTQRKREGSEEVYMLVPQRPNMIVPPGVNAVDPFAKFKKPQIQTSPKLD